MDRSKKAQDVSFHCHTKHTEQNWWVGRLEKTRLERSGKGHVLGYLGHLVKMIRRKGGTWWNQVIHKMCSAFLCVVGGGGKLSFLVHHSIIKYLSSEMYNLLFFPTVSWVACLQLHAFELLLQSLAWCVRCTGSNWAVLFIRRCTFGIFVFTASVDEEELWRQRSVICMAWMMGNLWIRWQMTALCWWGPVS